MSAIDTLALLAVVLVTASGVWALPWSQREVSASARAFGTVRQAIVLVVGGLRRGARLPDQELPIVL